MDRETRRKKMKQIQQRKKRVRLNRAFILVLIIMLASLAVVYGQRRKIKELNASYNEQLESQKRLKERVDALQAEIKQANTLDYIEKKAREELGMIKQNEKIYLEENNKKEAGQNDAESSEEAKDTEKDQTQGGQESQEGQQNQGQDQSQEGQTNQDNQETEQNNNSETNNQEAGANRQ